VKPTTGSHSSFRRERSPQPGLRNRPLANNCGVRDVEDRGRLLDRQPAEVAELDDACLTGAEGCHSFERLVQCKDVDLPGAVGRDVVGQRDACQLAATLVGPTCPRQVDEDPSHDAGCCPEEVGSTQPPDLSLIDESDVGFVHEGRWLQRMACRFTAHVRSRQAPEVVVEKRYEFVERVSPAGRGDEQLRYPRRLGGALIHLVASRIGENGPPRKDEGSIMAPDRSVESCMK